MPENVLPVITDRDFVIATVAAPTVIKEPEKPAEGEVADGEAAETKEGAEPATDGKDGEQAKKADAEEKDEKPKETSGDKGKQTRKKTGNKKKIILYASISRVR